ncbi:hypothetical protein HYPSUDRAFT_201042 [Hypholoma sublateritium FD-334 SS-4]|uniref:NmrA-like domain-containing protein n=1 Tax=Hypholoma sublateritium (strain FD-334 SS-4) TaxID=945553 RepID=A0A0D2NYW4_HYPSF|nr:hypothetical protein HYPSUDRAFT_201042 [Hypholoma sublateritium FD-334 SS-4]
MTILITGGTGKTGTALARRLQRENIPVLLASRSGKAVESFKTVTFDWTDAATFGNPFQAASDIKGVYILTPSAALGIVDHVKTFISLARSRGVKRFVLLSASMIEAGQSELGQIHQCLIDSGVEYAVLRPTWFQQNFGVTYLTSIRDQNSTFSATEDGRIPFVSTEDIAEAAYQGLTAEPSLNKDLLIVGPELFSHDEAAKLFSTILGREITHKRLTIEELKNIYLNFAIRGEHAGRLAEADSFIANHSEEDIFNSSADKKFVGKHTLEEYIRHNRERWISTK